MGMDFIAAYTFAKKDTPLDWDAGLALVGTLTNDEVNAYAEKATGEYTDFDANDDVDTGAWRDQVLVHVHHAIEALRVEHEDGARGHLFTVDTPDGYTLYLAGGMSGGDDPSDAFTVLDNLLVLPRVVQTIGFRQ